MTREKLIEVMARAMAPRCWEVMDAERNRNLPPPVTFQFQHKASMAAARKALSALEEAGVRLVPVRNNGELIDGGERTSVSIFTPYAEGN